jgi:hypothetical protein
MLEGKKKAGVGWVGIECPNIYIIIDLAFVSTSLHA